MVYVRLLGRPDVDHGDGPTPMRCERRTQLLALLALRRAWVSREELATLLWPGHDRALALANVRKAWHLAQSLPWARPLEVQGDAVRWLVSTDLHAFEMAAREGRLQEALALRRGDLLDGFDDETNPSWSEWLSGERARFIAQWREVAKLRLAELEHAPHEQARLARELMDVDPLDEDGVVALLAAQGRLAQAEERSATYASYAIRLAEELGIEPSARVRIARSKSVPVAAGERGVGDGFVGRARELQELLALLARPECRLLTITGPGGVGKSHLLKQALRGSSSQVRTGALWIALDDLGTSEQVVARIGGELRLAPAPLDDPLQAICSHPRLRECLLVLDNAEHLDGLPRLIDRLLEHAPGAKICATSRARLGVRSEWLLPLRGLTIPQSGDAAGTMLANDAVRLYVTAAMAVRPDFRAEAHVEAIAELVRSVDGLPLAILLAANWARMLPVADVTAALHRSLDVLESSEIGEERPEHSSVRATFAQSWRLLSTAEQHAEAALSVFVGTFPLEAARHVTGVALPLLAHLADQSLLQMADGARCALHPLIRTFAAEKLEGTALVEAQRRHAEWYHRFLRRMHPGIAPSDPHGLDAIGRELENCRLAWQWAVAHAAVDHLTASTAALLRFFEVRGRAAEGLAVLQQAQPVAMAHEATAPWCGAEVMSSIAHMQYRLYRLDDAVATARQALKLARAAHGRNALFRCLNVLGLSQWQLGRHLEAKRIMEQSLRYARASNDVHHAVIALGNLGAVEKSLGHYERSRELNVEALDRQRQLGDWVGVAVRLNNLAALHQAERQWSSAREYLREGLAICEEHGVTFPRAHLLLNLAHVCFFAGELPEAERVGRQALVEARASANANVEATALLLLARLAVGRDELAVARTCLCDAARHSMAMGNVSLELDCVFCFGELLAREGDPRTAAALMRYYADRPEIEPADRALAEPYLRDAAEEKLLAETPLDALLERLIGPDARSPLTSIAPAHS